MEAHLDHLPGRDERAEPGEADRGPDRGADRHPRQGGQGGGDETRRGAPRARRDPPRARPRIPARVLRRHATARDDRDGPRVQSQDRHRGRAGHRARRHDSSADPGAAGAPQTRTRPLDDPDLPRPQRHGRDVRLDGDHVRREDRRARERPGRLQEREASVHERFDRRVPGHRGPPDPARVHPGPLAFVDQPAGRVPLPPAMQVRVAAVRRPGAGARPRGRRPFRRLPPEHHDSAAEGGDVSWRASHTSSCATSACGSRSAGGSSRRCGRRRRNTYGPSTGSTTTGKGILKLVPPTGGDVFVGVPKNILDEYEAAKAGRGHADLETIRRQHSLSWKEQRPWTVPHFLLLGIVLAVAGLLATALPAFVSASAFHLPFTNGWSYIGYGLVVALLVAYFGSIPPTRPTPRITVVLGGLAVLLFDASTYLGLV